MQENGTGPQSQKLYTKSSNFIHKTNSKWTKDLSIRPENIKLLEANIGSKFLDTGLGNDYFNLTSRKQ